MIDGNLLIGGLPRVEASEDDMSSMAGSMIGVRGGFIAYFLPVGFLFQKNRAIGFCDESSKSNKRKRILRTIVVHNVVYPTATIHSAA